jgi:hypothetical protein
MKKHGQREERRAEHASWTDIEIETYVNGNLVVEVRILPKRIQDALLLASFITDLRYVPKIIQALKLALKEARRNGFVDDHLPPSSSSEGGDRD